MKAWVLHDTCDIRYEDAKYQVLKPDWVTVRVEAAGICGSDIPRIYKNGAHKMPVIPGHEFSGVVDGIGKEVSPYWMKRRVGIYPLIPCHECEACKRGMFELCRDYDYIGSRRDGAFAECVNVPMENLIELPEEVSFEEAAMLEPMAVAVNAVKRGTDGFRVNKEAKVVVCGLGTIGLFVAMFLVEAGYKNIYGIGNKEGQKKRLMSLGIEADHYLEYREGVADEVSGSAAYFECVGRNGTMTLGIDTAGASGRVVLVGNPYSGMELDRDTYWKILRNELTVSGVWNSRFNGNLDDDWHYVLDRLKDHKINPSEFITHRLKMPELDKGFKVMRDKTEDYCKIMMAKGAEGT